MAAAFLPCSAEPWQTGRKQGSLSLQKAEIFHPELAHLCNKKGNTFKRAIPRNSLSQTCGKSQPLLDRVWGQVGPAVASPGGSTGLMGLGPHPVLCRPRHRGRAASRVGVLGLEEWSLERPPASKVLRAPGMVGLRHSPRPQGPLDAGLLLPGTRTFPQPGSRPAQGHTACSGLSASPPAPVARGWGAPGSGVFTVEAGGKDPQCPGQHPDPHSGQVRDLCGQMSWEALPLGLGLALSEATGRGALRLCPVLGAPHKAAGHQSGMPPAGVPPADTAEAPTLAPRFPMRQKRKAVTSCDPLIPAQAWTQQV